MSNCIGIIVDGKCDYQSLKKRFTSGFKIIKTDGPRGHTVSTTQIARNSKKQISILLASSCSSIIVLTDFEERAIDYKKFVEHLNQCLSSNPIPVSASVPNKMIENWYLADIANLSSNKNFLRDNLQQRNYEGTNGVRELKRLMQHRTPYNKTKYGPQMFEILRFEVARQNSESLDEFLDKVL